MHPSFDLDVPIQRLQTSREEGSKAYAIPEGAFEAPRSRIAAGEKVNSAHKSKMSLAMPAMV
jgi:hypothetical protein